MNRLQPKLVVFAGVFFTSFSAIFIRLSDAPSLAVAALRMSITVLMLLPFYLMQHLRRKSRSRRPGRRRGSDETCTPPNGRDFGLCLVSGAFLALHFAAWIHSLDLTTIASATVIVNTQPIFVLVGGLVLHRERVSKRAVGFIALIFAGSALLSIGDIRLSAEAIKGDAFALAGAVTVAGYMLIGRLVRRRVSATDYVMIVYTTSAVILIIMCIAGGIPILGYPPREYLLFAAMAFFCTILGHTLFNWALKYLKTAFVSTTILGEPVFATILGVIIFIEIPPALTVTGAVVVLTGLYLFVREERTVNTKSQFDELAKDWDANPVQLERTKAIADAIRKTIPLDTSMSTLDYGSGTGLLAFSLVDSVGSVLAVDTSEEMLKQIEEKRQKSGANIQTLQHDLTSDQLQNRRFDLLVTAMTLHHVEDVESLLRTFFEIVNPGGYLVVADLEQEDGSFHSGHVVVHHHGFDPEWMLSAMKNAGFRAIESKRVYEIDRDENGGYPVFIAFAQKDAEEVTR